MNQFDLNQIKQQMSMQEQAQAGVQQFVAETARAIYAELVAEFFKNRPDKGPHNLEKRDVDFFQRSATQACMSAPFVAKELGLPINIQIKFGDENAPSGSNSQEHNES